MNSWYEKYNLAKKFQEEYGHLFIPLRFEVKVSKENVCKLGVWIHNQRSFYKDRIDGKKNSLTDEKIKLLNDIGMVWKINYDDNKINPNWLLKYSYVKSFYAKNNNLDIPVNYYVNGVNIYVWLNNQIKKYNNGKLNIEQINLLNELNISWTYKTKSIDQISDSWMKKYELAKNYYLENGNLLIPWDYIVKDLDGDDIKLGSWINTQRRALKNINNKNAIKKYNLTLKQIELLDDIGMYWTVKDNKELLDAKWMKKYELAEKYYQEHGNLYIDNNYYCEDEIDNKFNLLNWINMQRSLYRQGLLDEEKTKLLEKLNIVWNQKNNKDKIPNSWLKIYEEAKKYYEKHGNLNIPFSYIINIDGKDQNLGRWISNQRELKRSSAFDYDERKEKMLSDIGMFWNFRNNDEYISNKWMEKYQEAKKYYEDHGDLFIPYVYMIGDSTHKYNLGTWIVSQRNNKHNGKLSAKKTALLNSIGMIWNTKEYKKYLEEIDNYYSNYILGKYDKKEIDELVNNGYLKYEDGNINKGDIKIVLERR